MSPMVEVDRLIGTLFAKHCDVIALRFHGGCIGQAREDIEATKTGLDKKIHAVAARSAVHLQEDALVLPHENVDKQLEF